MSSEPQPDRATQAQSILKRLTAKIGEISPEGLGGWPEAWEMVAEEDIRLTETLLAFQQGKVERQALVDAGVKLLDAWRDAGAAFLKQVAEPTPPVAATPPAPAQRAAEPTPRQPALAGAGQTSMF